MSLILLIIAIYIPLKIASNISARIENAHFTKKEKLRRSGFRPYKPSYGTYTSLNQAYAAKKRIDRENIKKCLKW